MNNLRRRVQGAVTLKSTEYTFDRAGVLSKEITFSASSVTATGFINAYNASYNYVFGPRVYANVTVRFKKTDTYSDGSTKVSYVTGTYGGQFYTPVVVTGGQYLLLVNYEYLEEAIPTSGQGPRLQLQLNKNDEYMSPRINANATSGTATGYYNVNLKISGTNRTYLIGQVDVTVTKTSEDEGIISVSLRAED